MELFKIRDAKIISVRQLNIKTPKTNDDWHIYIIRCKNGTLYTGIAKNVGKRFKEHQAQGKKCAKYLRGKIPLTLVYTQFMGSHTLALQMEKYIKNLPKNSKEKIIAQTINTHPILIL